MAVPCARAIVGCLLVAGLMFFHPGTAAAQHALGRSTGGIDRLQAERGIEGRFPSSRLTLEPEQYGALATFPDLGVLRVLPYYQFATAFSDNVFLQPRDREEDWTFVNSPGLSMALAGKYHLFELDYLADIIANARFEKFDRVEHDLNTRLTLTPARYFSVMGGNELAIRGVPPRTPQPVAGDPSSSISNMYVDNTTSVAGKYTFGKKTDLELNYSHENVDFERDFNRNNNFSVDSIGLDLYYRVLPKTRVYAEYIVSFVDNVNRIQDPTTGQFLGTNNVRHQVSGGAAWDPTAKLHGRIHGGFEWVDYTDLPLSKGPYYAGELAYDYSRRLRFGLRLLQTITETSPVANNVQDGANYQSTDAGLRISYKILRNLDWHVEGFAVTDNFGFQGQQQGPVPQSDRKDNLVGVETGLDWRIQRNVMVGISYQFQNDASKGQVPGPNNVPIPSGDVNSFRENLLTLYLSLVF